MKKNTYFVTFGNNHPLSRNVIGFVSDEGEYVVREAMHHIFGKQWAFIYQASRDANNGQGDYQGEWDFQHDRWGLQPVLCFEVVIFPYDTRPTIRLIDNDLWQQMVEADCDSSHIELTYKDSDNDSFRVYYTGVDRNGKDALFCFVIERDGFQLFDCTDEGEPSTPRDYTGFSIPRNTEDAMSDKLTQLLRQHVARDWESRQYESDHSIVRRYYG